MPRLLPRPLRLRTGPLPSVPYLGPQARRWQRPLPAFDLSAAASGSTRARWKPDPQASRAANPEPPSQRAEHRSGLLSTAFPSEKTPYPCVTAAQTVIYNPQLRFTRCRLQRKFNGCVKAGQKHATPRKNTRDKVLTAHVVKSHPAAATPARNFSSESAG